MKIEIPVCTRGTLREFKKSYQPEFLSKYGYKRYTNIVPLNGLKVVCEAVNVKYNSIQGELIVHDIKHTSTVSKKCKMPSPLKAGTKSMQF